MFKSMMIAILTFGSLTAAASQTCFRAEETVPSYLPETVCFEDMTVEIFSSNQFVTVKGGLLAGRYLAQVEALGPDETSVLAFRSNLYNRIDAGCGFGEATDAVVRVPSVHGKINLKQVMLAMESTVVNDACHGEPSTVVIPYYLVQ